MGKLYYIIGKSSAGKDTIYQKLLEDKDLNLKKFIIYTTRPLREGEIDGEQYHFSNEEELKNLIKKNKVIEKREYKTVKGIWKYFTVDDGKMDLNKYNYIGIGTLESYEEILKYYGVNRVKPIYIYIEDSERLIRAITRERKEKTPNYKELCRRFLADSEDFSESNVNNLSIDMKFNNNNLVECINEIKKYILKG